MTSPTLVLGIDPGLTGAIALYDMSSNLVASVADMPTHNINKKNHIDSVQLAMMVDTYSKQIKFAVIEDVSSAPNQGVVSVFTFGKVFGIAMGIVAANYIPMFLVRPAVWKSAMGLTHDKDLSRKKASQLFPREAYRWQRKKDDGRAEALLLAVFGAKQFGKVV